MRNFIRKLHVADIYTKSTTTQPSGQKKASWTISYADIPCFVTPAGGNSRIRVSPTVEERDFLSVFFDYDAPIEYDSYVYNVRTRVGDEVVYDGPYEVDKIKKHVTFSGKVDHIAVTLKSVIE